MGCIKILFVDFWPSFDVNNNFITKIISLKYEYEIVGKNEKPDFLFYSCFGDTHYEYDCIKIYYTGENDVPNFNECDYAISFHYLDFGMRYIRLPLYVLYEGYNVLRNKSVIYPHAPFDREFCSVVVSNYKNADPFRINIIERLSDYKRIASGGLYANNIGGPVKDKLSFISHYKFNIAIENSAVDGYTTEKLIEPLSMATVPIYWGNKLVDKEINPEAFINLHDFNSVDSAISYIKKVDTDRDLYLRILFAEKLRPSKIIAWEEMFLAFLSNIFESRQRYISPYGMMKTLNNSMRIKNKLYSYRLLRNNISKIEKFHDILDYLHL